MIWSVLGRLVRWPLRLAGFHGPLRLAGFHWPLRLARFHGPLRLARNEPITIELDVVEQWMLLHLLQFERASSSDLRDVVLTNRRTASEQQVRLSLIRLNSLRLIEMDVTPTLEADQDRFYRITKDGKRLKVAIQSPPRSSIQTYL